MTAKTKRRTAAELIGFHLGWDMRDVSEGRYQSTRYAAPAIYVCGDDYYCAPSGSQVPPKGWNWEPVGTYYARTVFRAAP